MLFALFSLLAAPAVHGLTAPRGLELTRALTPSSCSGDLFNYYYMFSAEDGNAVNFTYDAEYVTAQWTNNTGYFIAGLGWNPGSAQTINFQTYIPEGSSYVSIYGWTTDPLVEYRILEENLSNEDPSIGLTWQGNLTSDGGVYDIYETQRIDAPSILGPTTNFTQYWSIRQGNRNYGDVTTGNHFAAWAAAGMPLGTFEYQIVAVEGTAATSSTDGSLQLRGSVVIPFSPSVTPTPTPTQVPGATLWGQCSGIGFTGPTCCPSNTTCTLLNVYFSECIADIVTC
ncbi:concanavalin A-like lectin/glucanase domain-containing protein [Roridomyces roridus]|uniref:Endo-1,4-beta-xylanase n=1 Tax=Roridomyces roridus TaxID=1738132 RepID=A0AAD7BIU4_9AGAR|nr:concanavalin A-like lectin/glucanase domain-containing protein [Roridomyces roridus]